MKARKTTQESTVITARGTLTLPASMRRALGLSGKQQVLLETTPNGEILVRPAALVPVELYTEARIAEFASEEARIAKWLSARKRKRK